MNKINKIPVGVSSCLLGEHVRYDGGHKRNSYIVDTLSSYFEFQRFCPEVAIGMGVPRETIQLVDVEGVRRVRGVENSQIDVTQPLIECANQQQSWQRNLCGYIVKKGSPSCGKERVKVYRAGHYQRTGVGQYTQILSKNLPYLPIEDELRLSDKQLRANFIQRVFVLSRWREMSAQGLSLQALRAFHIRHYLIYLAHSPLMAQSLDAELEKVHERNVLEFSSRYLCEAMNILSVIATLDNHANVLLQLVGQSMPQLSDSDRKTLEISINRYRQGLLSLSELLAQLRDYFKACPAPNSAVFCFLQPAPDELVLIDCE